MEFLACPSLMHIVTGNHDFDFGTLRQLRIVSFTF
jgi:hypothetical protein